MNSDYIFCENNDYPLYIKRVTEYKQIPDFDAPPGHSKVSSEDRNQYMQSLKYNRICNIDGFIFDSMAISCNKCNYSSWDDFYWFYCNDCRMTICCKCCNEFCHDHNQFKILESGTVFCDLCDEQITNSAYKRGDMDLCLQCSEKDHGIEYIKKNNLEKIESDIHRLFPTKSFGSLLEWVPIIKDNDGNMVLLNCCADSPRLGKIALFSGDDHGRVGIFQVDHKLEDILQKLDDLNSKWKSTYGDIDKKNVNGWEPFYERPIKKLLEEYGYPITYG